MKKHIHCLLFGVVGILIGVAANAWASEPTPPPAVPSDLIELIHALGLPGVLLLIGLRMPTMQIPVRVSFSPEASEAISGKKKADRAS
jgi:hypothetical protein